MKRILPFCLMLIGFFIEITAQDQNKWREINSVTEWIEEVNNWPDSVYNQWYLKIRLDPDKDKDLVNRNPNSPTSFSRARDNPNDSIPFIEINKPVALWHVVFTGPDNHLFYNFHLKNIRFKGGLTLMYLGNNRFGFDRCVFDEATYLRLMDSRFLFMIEDCHFKKELYINNPTKPTNFILQNNRFDKYTVISSDEESISLYLTENRMEHAFSLSTGTSFKEVQISKNTIKGGLEATQIHVINSMRISGNDLRVTELDGAVLPQGNSYLPFEQFSEKLTIGIQEAFLDSLQDGKSLDFYLGKTTEELEDEEKFDALIASYAKLLEVYKSRSEMDSYNACYIEMKDKMTARSQMIYETNPTFNTYFDWQINRFTKVFSDYGTRPAKAIVIFFQVVLGFSVFYFFFPSSWNTTNNRTLMKRLSYLGSYFRSKEGLSDLFEKETKEEYKDYEEFKDFMSSSEKELPVYFKWLSRPLYAASVSRFNLTRGILRRTDVLNGKWVDLPAGKKATTGILIGLYLFFYLIYTLIIRVLNAITLSLNAFSTLGFGEIPTRGLARYVTIIQGFVGWFLLSIFLVSLIGQILN